MGGVETKFKQTEVGLIPEDWEAVPLVSLFDFKNGLNKEKKFFGKGTPILNYMDVYRNRGVILKDIAGSVTVTKQELQNYSAKKGDVFFTRTSETVDEIGISSVMLEEAKDTVFSGFVLRGRPKNNLVTDLYKKYCFSTKAVRKEIIANASYTTRALTNGRLLSKITILIPKNKDEQIAIANALSNADGYIESLEKLIAKKQLIKQGAMQQLLSPKPHWEVSKLGKVAEITRGASPRPIDDPKWLMISSLVGWVRISDVTRSIKTLKVTTQKLSDIGIKSSRYVERGNLIMSICATIGRPILTEIDVCIHDGFVVFGRPEINKEYLYYFLSFIEKDWSKNGQTGSQMNLNTNIINLTEIHFPKNKIEQEKIAKTFSDIDLEIATLTNKLTKAKNLKQGMMQQLLTGKIRLV